MPQLALPVRSRGGSRVAATCQEPAMPSPGALNAESCLLPVSSRPGAGSEFGVNLVLQEPAEGGTFDYHRGACPFSSCRSPQAALKISNRSDRVTRD